MLPQALKVVKVLATRFDLIGIMLGIAGLATIFFAPPGNNTVIGAGIAISFIGAVVYGGVPSTNTFEALFTKIQFPVLIMATTTAILIIKLLGFEAFQESLLTWSFGAFFVTALFAPVIQKALGVGR